MSTKPISKTSKWPYKKPTEDAKGNANSVKNAQTQSTSVNGAKLSGKPYLTPFQYGNQSSLNFATSQNGGASVISISVKGEVVKALSDELEELEKLQLQVGEKMAVLLFEQMRLAEKCRAINKTMQSLLK